MLCSTPEIASLNTLTERNANGGLTSTDWVIKSTDVSGAVKTITGAGTLPHLEIARLSGVGGVVITGRIQLTTDSITTTYATP